MVFSALFFFSLEQMSIWKSAVALGAGVVFGAAYVFPLRNFIFETFSLSIGGRQSRGQVVLPDVILGQFTWQKFTMMKFFLAASATSFLANTILHLASRQSQQRLNSARDKNTVTDRSLVGTILGASLLGSGMALSATCPGTVRRIGRFIARSIPLISSLAAVRFSLN